MRARADEPESGINQMDSAVTADVDAPSSLDPLLLESSILSAPGPTHRSASECREHGKGSMGEDDEMMEVDDKTSTECSSRDPRETWRRKTEYILSCLGYCIGLSNVWRFPYLCYKNGGGAFLIPYFTMLFLAGIPMFYLEVGLSQFLSSGVLQIFKICPIMKGAGYCSIVVNFVVSGYYNVIIAYALVYLVLGISASQVPWYSCGNSWNSDDCIGVGEIIGANFSNVSKTSTEEFFNNYVLERSEGIDKPDGVVWHLLVAVTFAWVIVFLCLSRGIRSLGKVVYFTATFPFLMLFIMLIRGVTLPGASDGIYYYITPKWDDLLNVNVWGAAAVQIFFSLGPGWGGYVTMASYNPFKNNIKRDAQIVPILNCLTSVFAGFVVFSVLGYLSHVTGRPIENVVEDGTSLAFVTYPQAIALMPMAPVWAAMFFFTLFTLGLDSQLVQVETVVVALTDSYRVLQRFKAVTTAVLCGLMYFISIACVTRGGIYLLKVLDWYSGSLPIILACLIEVIMVAWIYGIPSIRRDLNFMIPGSVGKVMAVCWMVITPIFLMMLLFIVSKGSTRITYGGYEYPDWAVGLGWMSAGVSMVCIPLYMIYRMIFVREEPAAEGKSYLRGKFAPASDYGPLLTENRRKWEAFKRENPVSWKIPFQRSWNYECCRDRADIYREETGSADRHIGGSDGAC